MIKLKLAMPQLYTRQALAVVAGFALIGSLLLAFSRAATTSVNLEAESASLGGVASVITDAQASGQKAVKFGGNSTTPPPNGGGTTSSAATLVAVSDMQLGEAGSDRQGTADRTLALAADADYVIMAGDLSYNGLSSEYSDFDGLYGAVKSKIRPSPGNHDNYSGDKASAYDTYFGSVPHGTNPDYWYSFDAGAWHIVSLNAGVDTSTADYGEGSKQLQWLESDLTANASKPTLLFFHAPRYTGANYRSETGLQDSVKPIWNIALAHKVDLIVNGHDHSYQRFAKMDAEGNVKSDGIREIIAATGCYSQRDVYSNEAPNLQKWSTDTSPEWCGALQLKLFPDRYEWSFYNNAGTVKDNGTEPVNAR